MQRKENHKKESHNSSSFETPREIAYLALLSASKEERFIADTLDQWIADTSPSPRDAALAKEIAYGACRMGLALDCLAAQCTDSGKLNIKAKEKALLRTALYQHFYLDRIPLYAIANETLPIARKYCHPRFADFLNAILRKLEHFTPQLPQGIDPKQLSICHSYPLYFVEELINAFGQEKAIEVLEAGNHSSPTLLRLRKEDALNELPEGSCTILEATEGKSVLLKDASLLGKAASSPNFYIQNATPTALMNFLKSSSLRVPKRILDLCASPGGKLLLAHDLFPGASLYGNDVNEEKMEKLKDNLSKYHLKAELSCGPGEGYSCQEKFDLIILDVPCSNTGVLNKRPEARWRLSGQKTDEITALQKKLLDHAAALLTPEGEIWYMTCSILPEENERLVKASGLKVIGMKTILPNREGWDGGFAALCRV